MNLLFWNINKIDNAALIRELLVEREVDVAAFAEHEGVDFSDLIGRENIPYHLCDPVDGAKKVRIIMRNGIDGHGVFGQSRYLGLTMEAEGRKINIFAVHLEDCRNDPNGAARQETVRHLVDDLRSQEEERGCRASIVIGDFNVQPFSNEMVWATLLNATFFKEVAVRMGVKTVESHEYPFMYNPTLEYFSEAEDNCGSFYYSDGGDAFYWYCLDQAIVSPSLADSIVQYKYLRRIGDTSLIGDVAPKRSISDHLPLYVRIDGSDVDGR